MKTNLEPSLEKTIVSKLHRMYNTRYHLVRLDIPSRNVELKCMCCNTTILIPIARLQLILKDYKQPRNKKPILCDNCNTELDIEQQAVIDISSIYLHKVSELKKCTHKDLYTQLRRGFKKESSEYVQFNLNEFNIVKKLALNYIEDTRELKSNSN